MILRLIVFKVTLFFLVIGLGLALAIRDGVNDSLSGEPGSSKMASHVFKQYPLPLAFGCTGVACLVAFGDLLLAGRRKDALPTYTDEEFLAKFGGSPAPAADAQQPSH